MCGVNQLSERKTYDVYATSLRCWSIIQIILVFAGVILLVPIVARHSTEKSTAASQGVIYRLDTGKKVTIEIDEGKIKIGGETK
jgi:hypothetical protein